jgi:predicted alpha/beta superfamily hydrolase
MIMRLLTQTGFFALTLLALSGASAPAAPTSGGAEEVIPNTRSFDFVSKINGHRYRISVALPFTAAPRKGFAALYVLDGYWYFASATEVVRLLGNPANVVVIGIGYPQDPAYLERVRAERAPVMPAYFDGVPLARSVPYLERTYDLTLPASDKDLAAQSLPGTPKDTSRNVGGVDAFLKVIETEVKPRVAAMVPIDTTNQALFGHSFGGLATLHALFVEPNAFRTFLIASPSIWWNNKEVLADEGRFAAAVTSGEAAPRALVTVGGEESTPQKLPAGWGIDQKAADASLRKSRMVENASELVVRLRALHGKSGYRVEGVVFDKESHSASPWSALSRGIPFAFADAE